MGKIKRIIGCLLLMVLIVNSLPSISISAALNQKNLEVVEPSGFSDDNDGNTEVTETPKSEISEEPNEDVTEESNTEVTEESQLDIIEEPKVETPEEPKVQGIEQTNLEAIEELDSRVVDMNIISTTMVTAEDAKIWAKNKGATQTFINLADLFWKYSKTNGNINPAIAYVQSAKETGYGKFGGVIDESYFNTAGIKTPVGGDNLDPNAHHRFKNWDEGVQAHLDHLALYAGESSYPRATSPDPRHFPYLKGTATTVKALGAKWATSDKYGVEILNLYYDLVETSKSTAKLITRTTIDEVKVDGTSLYVRGWAVNKVGVETVNVYLDDKLLGSANYGLSRPDVDKIYPGYPNGGLSGYDANFDIKSVAEGKKTIKVEQISSVGVKHQYSKTITISRKIPKISVDSPVQNESIKDNLLFVKGWALNDSGIKEVKVTVDGKSVGNATYGLSRVDVNKIYPGYPSGDKGGYELNVDVKNIASGNRKVIVEAVGHDGVSTKVERIVNIPSKVKKPAIMSVDSPVQNESIKNNSLFIRGWALNESGIKEVKVTVDGKSVGNATYGLSRTDVNRVYPGYPNGDKGGYELKVDVKNIASGNRKVIVEAIGHDGVSTKVERTVNIPKQVKKPAIMSVDSPVQNESIKNNSLFIRGWALNESGIKEVKVTVDGKSVGNATYGLSRTDVNKVYPGYPNGDKGGYELKVDVKNIASGNRKVIVEAIGHDGVSTKVERTVNIPKQVKKPAIMSVDSPVQNESIKNDSLFIRGWALNESGIKEVKVSVDGKSVGNATYGLSRVDVNKIYPGYPNGDKGGYELKVDVKSIASGNRKVVVEAIGHDGVSTKVERTVNIQRQVKKPAIMSVDSPTQDQVDVDGSLFVRGWALNESGIKEVKVYVDNKFVQNATIGLNRADVDKVYPGYLNGDKGGYEANINISGLSKGKHTIKVVAIGNDNVATEVKRDFKNTDKKVIVVDAGHNYGGDQGAFSTHKGIRYSETEINILIADKVRNELEASGYIVLMTREVNQRPTEELRKSLAMRVDMANQAEADLFISIHQNSSTSSSANGTEVYYSDATPGSRGILLDDGMDLTINRGINRTTDKVVKSKALARSVVDSLSSEIGLTNRGVKNEDFYVVKNTNMPSILIECGFISNYNDLCKTTSTVKQNQMAKLIAQAVKKHF